MRHLVGIVMMIGAIGAHVARAEEVRPIRTWFGALKDAEKRKFAPVHRFLTDAEDFEKLWRSWKPDDKLPPVDFGRDFIVVHTEDKNRIDRVRLTLEKNGNLVVEFGFTPNKADPLPINFGMAQVRRAGVKTVAGAPLDK